MSEISRMEVAQAFKGRTINFLSKDIDLMAGALNRGILPQVVNKRSALRMRFNTLRDDVLVTESDR